MGRRRPTGLLRASRQWLKVGDTCFSFSLGYGSCGRQHPEGSDIPYRASASRSSFLWRTAMSGTRGTSHLRKGSSQRLTIVSRLALLSRSPGHVAVEAPVFKYAAVSEWERLHEDDRAAYIARSIEILLTMAGPGPAQRAARHYSQCIVRSQLTAGELASFLRECVKTRPELQGNSVQAAMNNYLNALCGQPVN
jgi:hypothetical protein